MNKLEQDRDIDDSGLNIKTTVNSTVKSKNIGGQAVIEGVMMRGKKVYSLAVRTPDNNIFVETKDVSSRSSLFNLPIFRGIISFWDSLVTGTKILMRSAEIAGENIEYGEEPSKFDKFLEDKLGDKLNDYLIYFSVIISIMFSIGLFFLLPVYIGDFFKNIIPGTWALGIIEGLVRMILFLVYIFLISHMKEIKRVFQYHGAEHKTINCFEAGEELTVENVMKKPRLHKRCGTSFLLIVMAISMIIFMFVRVESIWIRFISRIVLVPFIAGISYEVIKWAGKSESPIVWIISYPGLCLQKLTTKDPDEHQVETAIAALKGVLEVEPEK